MEVEWRMGGRPRGFGFVTMGDEASAESAISQLDGLEVAGRALKVNIAKERQESWVDTKVKF